MIYVLEDDDNIRKLIKYSLTSQGFEVQDFSLPSEFWQTLENCTPNLILLDIMLPEEDGISILKKIRSNPEKSNIAADYEVNALLNFSLVIVTGY